MLYALKKATTRGCFTPNRGSISLAPKILFFDITMSTKPGLLVKT